MDFIEDMLRNQNGAASAVAQQWAKDKILDMMTKRIGQVCGSLISAEPELIICGATTSNGYMYFGIEKWRIGIDFRSKGVGAHGLSHIDIFDGYAQKANKIFEGSRLPLFL